jgi:hypothetical protein
LVPKPLVPKPLVPESLVPESLVPKPLVPKPLVPKPLVPESLVPEPVIPEPTVAKPFATTVSTSDPKHPKSLGLDPLTIDMNDTVALYDSSSRNGKKQLECEEAIRLEGLLNELYTSQSGRSRGWTKTGLTALLQPRCASGGDIKELEKSKKAFLWALVVDDKVYSSFLDYICVAKQIRVAVWFEEDKYVVLFPAADRTTCPADTIPLYNITSKGLPHRRVNTCEDLLSYCDTNNLVLMPPHSIFHSLSTLTLSELESVGTKMGCIGVTGTKKERVAKLANWKLRQRLLS